VAGSSALQSHNWVGQHIPLHATSNGKVLLSGLDDDRLGDVLRRLPAYTDTTITKRSKLRHELDRVRADGYAVAVDELEVGLAAVAAPIRNAHGDVIASMSVSGPTFRMPADRIDNVVKLCIDAADEVSHRLGWGHR
jgi:DNA-binding IclR family transcriptional regulator